MNYFKAIICLIRTVYYFFRYPVGYYLSGHEFIQENEMDKDLKCKTCGYISKGK